MFIDEISINFTIPATDPLGKNAVVGKVRFLADKVEINSRYQGNVFRGGEEKLVSVDLTYADVEKAEVVSGWFRVKKLVLHVGNPDLVKELPGMLMGKLEMHIEKNSGEEAKKLKNIIDYKRSEFILDSHEARLQAMREKD